MTVGVLIADDQALVRACFRLILESQPDIDVVGEAADGAAAVSLASQLQPDVILMDIRMPGLDGIAATRQLTESYISNILSSILCRECVWFEDSHLTDSSSIPAWLPCSLH